MGYYASYEGHMRFNKTPDDNVLNILTDCFGNHDYDADGLGISVYGDDKYYEDYILEKLHQLEPMLASGEIAYHGEDDTYWRFILKNGAWKEESGTIYYASETPSRIAIKDIPEFLGQIIDIFDDALNKKKPVFQTEKYSEVEKGLNYLMKRWNVY